VNSGKWIIAVIFVLAALATAGAIWFHYQQNDRAIRHWGGEAATLIVRAKKIEMFRLAEGETSSGEVLRIGTQQYAISDTADATKARGMIHLRQVLVRNESFDWDTDLSDCDPDWNYGLRFSDGEDSLTLAYSLDCPRVTRPGTGTQLVLRPVAEHLLRAIASEFSEAASRD